MMKVKIWQIEVQQSPRPVVAAMCSFDFWGRAPIFVAGRMSAKYKVGDSVDVVGYLTEGHSYVGADGVHRTVPAVAAFAMVKGGSLKKVRALHGKNPAPRP